MAACEKCWALSRGSPDRYEELLTERMCSPEEQAGPDAGLCEDCERRTVHQYAGVCMLCGRVPDPGDPGKEET